MFAVDKPESYPIELTAFIKRITRVHTRIKELQDNWLRGDDSRGGHAYVMRWEAFYNALAYRAYVIAANTYAGEENYSAYVRMMGHAREHYNTALHLPLNTEHDLLYLGGALSHRAANKRIKVEAYDTEPNSKPLNYKKFTARTSAGRSAEGKAAIIGNYAFSNSFGKWMIFHADTGLPFAVFDRYEWKRPLYGQPNPLSVKKYAHLTIRPLAALLPDINALHAAGFSRCDGSGKCIDLD